MKHTTMWVGGGDVTHTKTSDYKKIFGFTCKTNRCVCIINKNCNKTAEFASTLVYKLCNTDHEIGNSLNWLPYLGVYITYAFCLVAKLGFISADA